MLSIGNLVFYYTRHRNPNLNWRVGKIESKDQEDYRVGVSIVRHTHTDDSFLEDFVALAKPLHLALWGI